MNKLKVATVFSGIGAFEFALRRLNIPHEIVFACDNGNIIIDIDHEKEYEKIKQMKTIIEKKEYVDRLYKSKTNKKNYVQQSYQENYQLLDELFYQDVRLLDGSDFKDQVDILVGGSPCQSFSSVGYQNGIEDTRGTLFYEFVRLIDQIKPKIFIFENVRGLRTHDKGNTWKIIKGAFESLNYHVTHDVLNASDYGIPQTRRRVFVVGFRNETNFNMPTSLPLQFNMQDFLIEANEFGSFKSVEGNISLSNKPGIINDKYFLTPKLYDYVMKSGTKSFYQKPEIDLPVARTILSTMGNRHRAGIDNYVTVDGKVRMLSEREALRLMGFTDDFKLVVSRAQAYKQAGNSIVVDVFIAILLEIRNTRVVDF